jgi:hypothetical protein
VSKLLFSAKGLQNQLFMKISLIHPSRSRPEKSCSTIDKWINIASGDTYLQLIVSLDEDDDVNRYINTYSRNWLLDPNGPKPKSIIVNKNRSCVDAINNAAKKANGDILIVVSDDTDCFVIQTLNICFAIPT